MSSGRTRQRIAVTAKPRRLSSAMSVGVIGFNFATTSADGLITVNCPSLKRPTLNCAHHSGGRISLSACCTCHNHNP